MYVVPMDMPKFCNHCPFGHTDYSFPLWNDSRRDKVSSIDGEKNKQGSFGYICNVDFAKNGKYTKVMRAKIGEDILRPQWCELKAKEA